MTFKKQILTDDFRYPLIPIRMAIIVKINASGNVEKKKHLHIADRNTNWQRCCGNQVGVTQKKKKKQTKTKIELPYDPDMPALVSKSQHSTEIFAHA